MKGEVGTTEMSFHWPSWVSNNFLQPVSVEISTGSSSQEDHLKKTHPTLCLKGHLGKMRYSEIRELCVLVYVISPN